MTSNRIIVIDAPSNLGLSPPGNGVVPGCYKLPWAMRDRNLLHRIDASDGGCIVPPRYESYWIQGEGDRNAQAIARYSIQLANRLESVYKQNQKILVLGGDCSILIGSMLTLKRRGRYGLVFIDAHSDFRHPGNSKFINAAAGEDLAIVTGRGDSRLINLEGSTPYVLDEDVHIVGIRAYDAYLQELKSKNIEITTSRALAEYDLNIVEKIKRTVSKNTDGYWIHFDCDVIDESEMPAVDCPESDGLSFEFAGELLGQLLQSSKCLGVEVTIYDPDLDPSGIYADALASCLIQAFSKSK